MSTSPVSPHIPFLPFHSIPFQYSRSSSAQLNLPLSNPGSFYNIIVWSAAETHLAVVSACLPTLRPLAQKLLPSSLSHSLNKAFRSRTSKSHEAHADFASQGKEFQRLQDYHPSDGMARAEAGFGVRGLGRGERDGGGSRGEISVKSDIWVQQNLRESDGERFAGGGGGKTWSNAGV